MSGHNNNLNNNLNNNMNNNFFPGLFTNNNQYSSNQYNNIPPPPPGFNPINESRVNIDELLYANYMLNSNLLTLNYMCSENYKMFTDKINFLKKENEELQKKIGEKRNFDEIKNNGDCCNTNNINPNQNNNKSYFTNNYNKYQIRRYYPNNKSWSYQKINNFLKDMKEIKDILKLKYQWYFVRHNYKLSKLCNLIPAIEKLEKMVGLDKVKKDIFKIIVYYIQNPHTDEYLHTVITGPPGVGKTVIAKIYSDIFVRLGVLKTDKFIEIKRDDLVGKYLGQTAPRTRELLESAMGGVVFLDEGYSLGNDEKRDSFAKEAIDMINQYLSERKKDFMFVIAGYEDDLENCFFSFNRGLKRRFSHWIEITKYEKNELVEIFKYKVKDYKYTLNDNILTDEKQLLNFFDKNYSKFENFAGDIEKFLNYIKYEQSFRTFKSNESNKIINIEDLNSSIEKFKSSKKYESPMGLYC